MILRRFGNKSKIAKEIQKYFPPHKIYIEPFFGAGGMFFNKPQSNHNFLNDIDANVYNVFNVLIRYKKELTEYLELIPYHIDFWNECKTRNPENKIEKAVYFIVLSNFGYMGKPNTLRFRPENNKKVLIENIELSYKKLVKNENIFLNNDFREIFNIVGFRSENEKLSSLIYSDPPYLGTADNYNMQSKWTEKDVVDCMDITFNSGINGAMSEFDNEFILQQAKERNLNVIIIGERRNLKNRRTEILITNYRNERTLFDCFD